MSKHERKLAQFELECEKILLGITEGEQINIISDQVRVRNKNIYHRTIAYHMTKADTNIGPFQLRCEQEGDENISVSLSFE